MAMRKKSISFGLVNIPIELNPIIINNDTAFNQLHKKCGSRIKYQKICPHCKVETKTSDIIKGYEYVDDKYITFTTEDLNKLKLANDSLIEIISFVDLEEIDPIYFEKSYYLTTKNNKAFELFKSALNQVGKVALGKTVLGTKFYYVILRLELNHLILNTLYFEEEINLDETSDELKKFSKEEMELATKLIAAMSGKFEPNKYKDEYQDRIKKAIKQKANGKKIEKVKGKTKESITDLMKALKMSLKEVKK